MTTEYSSATVAAKAAQEKLKTCLNEGKSFRLEAGAGAGKTYSLVEALRGLIDERGIALMKAGQKVACITYTEVARNEIAQDIEEHPAILVNTIHGFGWALIAPFQKELRQFVSECERYEHKIKEAGGVRDQKVEYSSGYFGIDEQKIMLSHDDIPMCFAEFLGKQKFQQIFSSLYPVLFVDEYQDTNDLVMDALLKNVCGKSRNTTVGFFGDFWQTIYKKSYNPNNLDKILLIKKESNFRSVPDIVNVLNNLREDLYQNVKDDETSGEARFFYCNDYWEKKVKNGEKKLSPKENKKLIDNLREKLKGEGWDFSQQSTKILMLTHKAIAAECGYQNIISIYKHKDDLLKKQDATIAFLADVVEPLCQAYHAKNYGEMFRLMGKQLQLCKPADKLEWQTQMDKLVQLCASGTIGEVLDHLKQTKRPHLPDKVAEREAEVARSGSGEQENASRSFQQHRKLREVNYCELRALIEFIDGFTPFATQHSVKGAEFENVLVILSDGWTHYNWPKFFKFLNSKKIDEKNQESFVRWRNLFYVAISRPKKRLAVLITQHLEQEAIEAAKYLFGTESVIQLSERP